MNPMQIARDFRFMAKSHKAKPLRFEVTRRAMISIEAAVLDLGPMAIPTAERAELLGVRLEVVGDRGAPSVLRLVCEGMTLEARA